MRTFTVVVLFAFVTAASALAQAPAPPIATVPETTEIAQAATLPPRDFSLPRLRFQVSPPQRIPDSSDKCYTMRSYLMRRENRFSDVTRQRGYTTCTPASRFHFKAVPAAPKP